MRIARNLPPQTVAWLREVNRPASPERLTLAQQAQQLGVHVDTLRRILTYHHIRDFGRRWGASVTETVKKWNRPCTICGSTVSRPRMQFRCDACKERQRDIA